MTIGGLSIRLLTGQFVVDDLAIGGLHPGDQPFLTAKRIEIAPCCRRSCIASCCSSRCG